MRFHKLELKNAISAIRKEKKNTHKIIHWNQNANNITVCRSREPSAQVSVPLCPCYPKNSESLHLLLSSPTPTATRSFPCETREQERKNWANFLPFFFSSFFLQLPSCLFPLHFWFLRVTNGGPDRLDDDAASQPSFEIVCTSPLALFFTWAAEWPATSDQFFFPNLFFFFLTLLLPFALLVD